jgi:signal transduction histidine kinase
MKLKRLIPNSMAGQLIGVLLLALIIAQLASLAILHDDRRLAFIFVSQQDGISRTVSVLRLLNKTEPALQQTIVNAASSRRLRFQLSDRPAVTADRDSKGFESILQKRLRWELSDEIGEVRVAIFDDVDDDDEDAEDDTTKNATENDGHNPFLMPSNEKHFREWGSNLHGNPRHSSRHHHRDRVGMTLSAGLKDGDSATPWLNVYSLLPPTNPTIAIPSMIAMGIMAILLVIIVVLMVRRVTRPLARLTDSAERFGRGEDVGVLPEVGPQDIRKASRAFNDMQKRLTRFVQDRTRTLAAITHDLRTPITSLRIRAEMIEDAETREKILETLTEMQSLTEAALDFARQEASMEETRTVDLISLVDSLCQDLIDVGQDVAFVSGDIERLPYDCHPLALKRAFRNVIENAVRYGEKAEVGVSATATGVCIIINDNGPGISAKDQDRIFDPFVRLEISRSRETGGIGLGLAISRSIIHSHGGDIKVSNGEGGGAIFSLWLPPQN